ncbi:hypothetical protein [Nostoc sp.]|uniref:hypothetical protein n=1 Tax=Nostoc sp. TaxID=1180 RepID=UPI002FF4F4AC
MRYRSRNTTPVATTDSAALASQTLLRTLEYSLLLRYRASGTSLWVTLLRRYRYANTSRLQRWIHRNALAPLQNNFI